MIAAGCAVGGFVLGFLLAALFRHGSETPPFRRHEGSGWRR